MKMHYHDVVVWRELNSGVEEETLPPLNLDVLKVHLPTTLMTSSLAWKADDRYQ